ncbi:MAG: hypothetical protein HRT82_08915 [Henriciella sp.]|nr:hypothetical protein [Henriciella sp.]
MAAVENETAQHIPNALEYWRQGDFVLDCGPFIFADKAPPDNPDGLIPRYADGYRGFAVISQTCDIVRSEDKLPCVVVAPLVEVTQSHREMIARGRAPRFVSIENAPEGVVVDLAQAMSVSKTLLTTWPRTQGFDSSERARRFAYGLERAFGRFAFPEDFNTSIARLRKKIQSKYGNPDSPLGKALDLVQELRVRPSNDWNASTVSIKFFLIFETGELEESTITDVVSEFKKVLAALDWTGAFTIDDDPVRVGSYDDFSARDYRESVPLDLNALSFAEVRTKSNPD